MQYWIDETIMLAFALWIDGGWVAGTLNKEVVMVYYGDLELWVGKAH